MRPTDVLDTARAELGVREDPPESNRVKYNDWYYGRTVIGSAYPWCMAFVQWCFAQAGRPLPFRTASCSALLGWYRQNRPECVVGDPQPGDIIIYTFSHTGIVESVQGGVITAIEGNTSAGNDANGGQVRRTRGRSLVKAYIRPFGEETEDDMNIDKLLEEMTDEQAYRLMAKAQAFAASLPEQEWSVKEGHWARATAAGVVNGAAPEGLVKRCEVTAILGRSGLL